MPTFLRIVCIIVLAVATASGAEGILEGHLTDNATGDPVSGATVTLDPDTVDKENRVTTSGPFGFFHFNAIPADDYSLTVTHDLYDGHNQDLTVAIDDLLTRSIKLTNPTGESFFDILVNVNGSQTNANLPGATVKVERWIGQNFQSTADQTLNLMTDNTGLASALNMRPGYFRVTVTKTTWNGGNPLIMPTGDPKFIGLTAVFQANLQPALTSMDVLVSGFNPFTEDAIGPLAGVNVELTGLDFAQAEVKPKVFEDIEVLPPQTGLTPFAQGVEVKSGVGGAITFGNLPPIRYRLVARKLGYLEDVQMPKDKYYKEIIVAPDANGQFMPVPIPLSPIRIAETKIEIILDSPFSITAPLEGATVTLTGIDGTTAEHISRELDAEVDVEDGKVKVLFENILPGTYGINIMQLGKTVAVQKPDNMPPFSAAQIDIDFFPVDAQLEASLDKCLTKIFTLTPVPAEIHGVVQATDTLSNPNFGASHDLRIFNRRETSVEFHLKEGIDLYKESGTPVVVEAAEDGRFTVRLPPGFYGIMVPELAQYYGHDISLRDRANPTAFTFEQGWPYKQVWPQDYAYEYGHHWSFVKFSSDDNQELSMQLHRHYTNIVNRIEKEGQDPCDTAVLSRTPDGSVTVTAAFEDFETYGTMHITGGDGARHTINADSPIQAKFFRFLDLEPGNYTITGTHPRYAIHSTKLPSSNTIDFTIAGWTTTGELPPISPTGSDPSYFFPGISHDVSQQFYQSKDDYAMTAVYPEQGIIRIEEREFVPATNNTPARYRLVTSVGHASGYFSPNWTDLAFRSNRGRAPAGGEYQVWYETDAGWFTASATGEATFEVYVGGDLHNVGTEGSAPPFIGKGIDLIVHAVSIVDPTQELDGIQVNFKNPTMLSSDNAGDPAGSIVSSDDANAPATGTTQGGMIVLTASDAAGKWIFRGHTVELVGLPNAAQDTNATYEVTVTMERGMTVSGTVKARPYSDVEPQQGEELEGARVDILDRYHGNILATTSTAIDGTFDIPAIDRQVVFVKISKNGYVPFRKRIAIADGADDLDIDLDIGVDELTIDALTPPKKDTHLLTLDRFGLFIPGVLKSGDAAGFNVDNARSALNLTWLAGADHPEATSYSLDSFDAVSGSVQPPQTMTIEDSIDRVILIDQRYFAEQFMNKPDDNEKPINLTSNTPPKDEIDKLLAEICSRTSENDVEGVVPFYVVSDDGTKKTVFGEGETAPSTDVAFTGTLELEDMPPGVFNPMVVFITKRGAARVLPYELPADKKPLQGIRLAPWAAGMLEFIGVQATTNIVSSLTTNDPRGYSPKGRLNWGGGFESAIDGSNDGYLVYEYGLSASFSDGGSSPKSGPLAMMSGIVGLEVGVKGTFKVDGKKEEVSLNLSGSLSKGFDKKDIAPYAPAIITSIGFSVKSVTISGSHKSSVVQPLSQADLDSRMVPDLIIRSKTSAFVRAKLSRDITDLVAGIAPLKVLAFVLNKFGVISFYATFDVGVGGGIERQITTVFPRPMKLGQTQTGPVEQHFGDSLGNGTDVDKGLFPSVSSIDVQLLAGAALEVSAAGDNINGSIGVQIGPPQDIVGQNGLKLVFNDKPEWPPVKSVLGAYSVVGSVSVSAGPFSFGRSFQKDLGRIEWHAKPAPAEGGRAVDPIVPTYFEIYSLNISDVRLFPSDGTPTTVANDEDDTVIDGIFDHEQYDIAGGTTPMMLYTSLNEQTGLLELIPATQQPDGTWITGAPIASAAYFSGVAIAEDPAGGFLAVWMEVDQANLANPFAPTTIKFATQATGQAWSAPQTLSALTSLGLQPKLSRLDQKLLLTFKVRPGGPFSSWHKLYSAVWDGSIDQWDDVPQLVTSDMIDLVDCAATGSDGPDAEQPAVLVTLDTAGIIRAYVYGDGGWTATPQVATDGLRRIDLVKGPDGKSYLAYDVAGGTGISLLCLDGPTTWSAVTQTPIDATAVHDLAIAVFDDNGTTKILMIWSVGSGDSRLFHAIVDGDGTVSKAPIDATSDVGGVMRRLRLLPSIGGIGATVFAGTNTLTSTAVRTFLVSDVSTVVDGPTILADPTNAASFAGSQVKFTTSATGTGALTYQWYRDHIAIDGATTRSLTLAAPTEADAGFYTVLVTDSTGETMSGLAELIFSDDYLFDIGIGWNAIGLPVVVTQTFAELLVDEQGQPITAGPIWTWNAQRGRFVLVPYDSVPQPGMGYFIHSTDGGVSVTFTGTTPAGLPKMFYGWNLITPQTATDLTSVFRLIGRIYGLENGQLRSANRERLYLLRGYWVFGKPIEP